MKKKHRLAAIFSCCLLLGTSGLSAAVSAEDTAPEAYGYGDVNLDKTVDVSDAVLLARFAAEDTEANISAEGKKLADVNQDGGLTSDDTILILQYIAKLIPALGPSGEVTNDYKTVNLMEGIEAGQAESKPVDAAFTGSQYAFAVNLLKQTSKENTEQKNLLISPLSVSMALSMTANGAKEQTLSEMEKVLGGDLKIADLNAYYADLLNTLPNNRFSALYPANSIWIRNDENAIGEVPQEFLQTNADYYGADAFKTAFNQQMVEDVNSWVNENTHKMIPKLLDQIPNDNAFMYLINALAFEADWAAPYDEYHIREYDFTPYQADPIKTEMLFSAENSYLEDEYATGFIKDYKGGDYSFAAILPNESESVTVSDYIGMMTPESLQKLLSTKQRCKVQTMTPKFKFDYNTELKNALTELGMPTAFDDKLSNFTGLYTADGYISGVKHKTFIQVDEKGTKAGAVTAVEMATKQSVEQNPKYVYLNRPFIFMILDNQHNIPVFIGYVMNPAGT